jgi:F-type H+-transporting ATPase subunit epsilon
MMHLTIVSLDREIFSQEIRFVVLEAKDGQVGIYPNHAPLISVLKPGLIRVYLSDKENPEIFFVSGGVLEVLDNKATILADTVERSEELDEEKVLQEKELALREKQKHQSHLSQDRDMFYNDLQVLLAKIEAVRFIRKKY